MCIFCTSIATFGLHYTTRPNSILGFVSKLRIPKNLAKPLFDCPMCMSSFWGVLSFLFFAYIGWLPLHPKTWICFLEWVPFTFGLVTFNYIFATISEMNYYFSSKNDE